MPEITVGHVFLATAAIELVFVLILAVRIRGAYLELPPERRGPGPYVIIAAGIVSAFVLCLLAFILPEARMRLF